MFSIRKSVVATLAPAPFVSAGATPLTAAVPANREVRVTSGRRRHRSPLIQVASDPHSSMSDAPVSTDGTRITW
jgi:hypothetical protein